MLLRGLYTFDPRPEDHDHTLPFTCNDTLIFLGVLKRDCNWIKVADIVGRIGYVPKTFVEPDEYCDNHEAIVSFLVDAVVKARQNDLESVRYLEDLKEEIGRYPSVITKRSMEMAKVFTPSYNGQDRSSARRTRSDQYVSKPTSRDNSDQRLNRIGSDYDASSTCYSTMQQQQHGPNEKRKSFQPHHHHHHRHQSPEYEATTAKGYHSDSSLQTARIGKGSRKPTRPPRVPTAITANTTSTTSPQEYSQLVSVIQESSGLSPRRSEDVMRRVLHYIKDSSSSSTIPVESLLKKWTQSIEEVPDDSITELKKLVGILSSISKDFIRDRRNKSGRLNDVEFSDKLSTLRKLLIKCDPLQVIPLLEVGHHGFSQDLVHLYHLESPQSIKQRMLDILLIICTLDKKGRASLLCTTLPIYLARELMSAKREGRLFSQLVEMLTTLLAAGEPMPDTHFEILGTGFINFLLKEIEDTFAQTCESDYDKVADKFSSLMNLILAYNLQFLQASKENLVLKVLADNNRRRPKGFLFLMIKLFQKGIDPLRVDSDEDVFHGPNSVFKLVDDFCLCQRTATHLTTSDVKSLVSKIVDGLLDNKAGPVRLGYLTVLCTLLASFKSAVNNADVRAALLHVLLDEDPLSFPEHKIIRGMSREFPALFAQSISRVRMNVMEELCREDDPPSCLSS